MLTIWLWGTVFALLLIGFSLWKWYWKDDTAPGPSGDVEPVGGHGGDSSRDVPR